MSYAEEFLPEFVDEMASLRRLLELVPEDRLDWRPHAKSRTLGELATHLAELPRWGMRFASENWQIGSEKPPAMRTAAEFLARFDENVSGSRATIAATGDDVMAGEFSVIRPDGQVFFRLPRRKVLRVFLLNHIIHHRGQFTVYLRLNDVPLPSVYGPTADKPLS
jgi:uncharacterized damage-inducible protein DinB